MPFRTYIPITHHKIPFPLPLFTKTMSEIAERIYITVHMIPMKLPGGVYEGFIIVGYQELTP